MRIRACLQGYLNEVFQVLSSLNDALLNLSIEASSIRIYPGFVWLLENVEPILFKVEQFIFVVIIRPPVTSPTFSRR